MIGYDRLGQNGRFANQLFQFAALRGIAAHHVAYAFSYRKTFGVDLLGQRAVSQHNKNKYDNRKQRYTDRNKHRRIFTDKTQIDLQVHY